MRAYVNVRLVEQDALSAADAMHPAEEPAAKEPPTRCYMPLEEVLEQPQLRTQMLEDARRGSTLQKQVHEVDLTLAGHLGGLVDAGVPIGVHHGGLLDLKQPLLNGALRGHIVVAALGVFDEVSVLPHPDEQPVLPDLHAVLAQQLCKLAHEDALLAGVHCVCKDALWRKFRDLPVFVLQFIVGGDQRLCHQFSPGQLREGGQNYDVKA